jgi:hypothetical protein
MAIKSKSHTFAIFIILTQNITVCLRFSGDQIKDYDMGRAGTAYGEEKSVIQGFDGENGERGHL